MEKAPGLPLNGLGLEPGSFTLVRSIKGQLFIVFAATLFSVFALIMLNSLSLSTVKERLLLGESYTDVLNNILEVRRYEKNFLFYHDAQSLQEGIAYLERIDSLVAELSGDITRVTDSETFENFQDALRSYENTIKTIAAGSGEAAGKETIRRQGKNLVDLTEKLVRIKRARIHTAIDRTSLLPVAFLAVFLLLILLVIRLVSQGLLRPLEALRATIQRVAKGDYSPTPYEGLHNDEVSGLIGAFNRMAEELETNQEHLLQARKMGALGTFTAGIAHELNNPINNISLTAETFLEEYAEHLDPDGKEMLEDILSQSERATEIVKNLLDFSRTEHPSLSSLSANEIVNSSTSLVKNQMKISGVRLNVEIDPGLPSVKGNLRNLQQVFMNLLLNAVQAMPEGGEVHVKAAHDSPGYVRIDIRDTGSGIDQEILEHIFEPFFTTKEVGRGTGLGLAVSYSIVGRHGGRMTVKSEKGKGSVFSIYLPVFTMRNGASAPAAESWDHARTHSDR